MEDLSKFKRGNNDQFSPFFSPRKIENLKEKSNAWLADVWREKSNSLLAGRRRAATDAENLEITVTAPASAEAEEAKGLSVN